MKKILFSFVFAFGLAIHIQAQTDPEITSLSSSPPCANVPVQYRLFASAETYIAWSVIGGQITAGDSARTVTVVWNSPGPGTVSVEYGLFSDGDEDTDHNLSLPVTVVGPLSLATSTGDICANGYVTLNASTGTGYTYQWYNGSGAISGQLSSSYNATAAGNYYAIVSQSSCSSTTNTVSVALNGLANQITSSGDICIDGVVTLTAPTGYQYNYQWYNDSGLISGATGAMYAATSVGNYYAVITKNSCSVTSNTIAISNTLCTITGPASPVCVNVQEQYQLSVVASAGITWSVSGGQIVSGLNSKTVTVLWNSPGAQSISIEYNLVSEENMNPQPPPHQAYMNVTVTGPQSVLTATGDTNKCSNASVTLNASTGSAYTYQWYNDAGVISGVTGSSYTTTAPGNYYAVITQYSCSSPTNTIAVTNATCNISGPATACLNTAYTYSYFGLIGDDAAWDANDGVITVITNRSISVVWPTIGPKVISLNFSRSQPPGPQGEPQNYSYSIPVTVSGSPIAITPTGSQSTCNSDLLVLSVTTGSGFTFQWYNDSGAIAGATNSYYNAGVGNYYAILTTNSCSAQSSTVSITSQNCQITTTPPIYANQETVITYSGILGTNAYWSLGDGIITQTINANSIKVKWLNGGPRTVSYISQYGNDQNGNPVSRGVSTNVTVIELAATIASDEFSSPPDSVNFVRTTDFLIEGITDNMSINSVSSTNYLQSTEYIDGHGRSVQTVHRNQSPLGNDLVQLVQYDVFNREPRKYLPIVTGSDGSYKAGIFDTNGQLLNNFYSNTNAKIASDAVPFAETSFEPSPLNRVIKQGAPGTNWQPDSNPNSTTDHTVKHHYEFNGATDVILFTYDPTTGLVSTGAGSAPGYYGANQLVANRSTDEQQNDVIEYVDKKGHTICKKVQSGTSAGVKLYASTYYIYDNLNNLVIVLPPEAINSALSSLTKN